MVKDEGLVINGRRVAAGGRVKGKWLICERGEVQRFTIRDGGCYILDAG
ncbi:MAG TPA: hypothetical protein VMW16_13340 [Sedimentisphaerales bacterium]|nr:hypothetical protein [Sedimentisphaerales bacterium]